MKIFKLILENLVSREFELDFRILYKRRGCGYDTGSMGDWEIKEELIFSVFHPFRNWSG